MLKINISFSKKIPGPEQYSSLSFHGSMERELSDGLSGQQIQEAFAKSYALLETTVESEIARYCAAPHDNEAPPPVPEAPRQAPPSYAKQERPPATPPPQQRRGNYGRPQGQGASMITESQLKFLNRLAAERGMTQQQMRADIAQRFQVARPEDLSKQEASRYIEEISQRRAS
ncbi:MAG: hypothetical protein RL095_294 [Verrucomicrobiota bacterium]|jgi:hypothetical protein